MYDIDTRNRALTMLRAGAKNTDVARHFGIPVGTIGYWRHIDRAKRGECPGRPPSDCPRCDGRPLDGEAYAYLLGLYLGDGHIVSKRKQHHLSIYCNAAQLGLIAAAEKAIRQVMAIPAMGRHPKPGCIEVKSYSKHWLCLFPQHGAGPKHERRIVLDDWQQAVVDEYPWAFVRGLIHSDGCRVTNWTTRLVGGERRRYEYPRYFFTNKSDDIRRLYTDTLDKLGIDWTHCNRDGRPYNVSVARKASVSLMDAHVGAKY